MTVGVIYRVPAGAVLVSDGRVTHIGEIVSDVERKNFLCGDMAIIVSGEIGQFWRRMQEKPPKTWRAFRAAFDASEDDSDWVAYDRRGGRLWLGDVRIASPYIAVGCGSSTALGALDVLTPARSLAEAEVAARRAVRAACGRHTECGGKVRTLVVPRTPGLVVSK